MKFKNKEELEDFIKDAAFPQLYILNNKEASGVKGLTKREYFAALAMQGLVTQPSITVSYSEYAKHAVAAADALIAELNK